jgi:ATP-dependent exoDNAse (exonuclease V) beta subunit
VPLTDEQEAAVERRHGALLLAANAGSGKTTVLVERFVRAVHEDAVSPGRILAITFTERAAGELRERVRRRLHELGDRGAARETEAAFVSTIHGFCARLLRADPLAAGLAPGFAVLDEGTAAGLRQEAFECALAVWMTGPAELDLAAACGVDRLAEAITRAHDELRSRGMTRPRLPGAGPRHDASAARADLGDAAAVLARELDAAGPARAGSRIAGALDQLGRVQPAGLGRHEPGLAAEHGAGRGKQVPLDELKLHRGAAALKSAAADAYEAARVRCCEARDDAIGTIGLDLLDRLLEGFATEFARLKQARGALDFDDLELCARDLLVGDTELRGRWSERFELLMIDELQDTNPREMSILAALDRDNLFTVGDEFQSIYGFRHADVEIFRRRRRKLAAGDGVRALSRNFRSRPPLVAAINATFAPIFGSDFVPLVAGRDDGPDEGPDREPLVELMLSDSAGWQETAPGEEPGPGPPWRRAEAVLLAQRIEELIESGAARPGEIVVLLRYATAAGVYGQALADRGIPIAAALGGGFYTAPEIADLGAYVRVLANPLDDVALYGVLASPLGGLGADALAVVGLAAKRLERPPWEVIAGDGAGNQAAREALAGLATDERERLDRARTLIERERHAAAGLGLAELLVRSGYRELALVGRGAALGLANLHKLLRLAREFESREGRDLRGFADRLAAGRLGSSRETHAQLAETDAVRLMTVHAAKGLEFPVVCVADLGHGPPIGAPVILTDGEQIGLRLPTLDGGKPAEAFSYTELRAGQGRAALAEEQRIAYVAMTRARERLILSGAGHFARWPTPGPFAAQVAWLAPAIVEDLADRLAGPTGVSVIELGGAKIRLTLTAAGDMPALRDVVVPELLVPAPGPPPRSAARGEYEQISLFAELDPAEHQPPAAVESGRSDQSRSEPAKSSPVHVVRLPPPSSVSYSSLVDYGRCGYGYYLRRVLGLAEVAPPVGFEPPGAYDAAQRGRAVHALLERLDFARPVVPATELIWADVGGGDPTDDERTAVAELAGAFARSPLCPRLADAATVRREASFALALGDLLVNGYIDVLAGEADGAMLVVDYKTDRIDPDSDLAGRVAADYAVQQQIYGLAALRAGATSVEVAYCFLRRPEDVVSVRYTPADAGRLEDGLLARAAPLVSGRFEVSPQPHRGLCATCPGRARLCSWEEALTLRETPPPETGEQASVQDA